MIMLSHGLKGYPTDENIYDFYRCGIIGVIVHGHVINIYILYNITIFLWWFWEFDSSYPCDPKFMSVSLNILPFWDSTFGQVGHFEFVHQFLNFSKNFISFFVQILQNDHPSSNYICQKLITLWERHIIQV